MERRNELHTLLLECLRRDIQEGLDSGAARPWSAAEMKRQGRKRLAAHKIVKEQTDPSGETEEQL
jgi:hypothetical protein